MNFVAQLHPSLVRISLYVHHDSHYHSPHYPVVPIEGARCIPRQLDYCSCSATTAVGYLAVIRLQRCTAAVIRIEVTPVSELSDSLIPRANRMDDCTPAGFSVLTSMPIGLTPALDERASTPVVPFEPLLVKSKPSKTAPVCSSRSNGPPGRYKYAAVPSFETRIDSRLRQRYTGRRHVCQSSLWSLLIN